MFNVVSFFVSCFSPKWEMSFLTGHFALVGKPPVLLGKEACFVLVRLGNG